MTDQESAPEKQPVVTGSMLSDARQLRSAGFQGDDLATIVPQDSQEQDEVAPVQSPSKRVTEVVRALHIVPPVEDVSNPIEDVSEYTAADSPFTQTEAMQRVKDNHYGHPVSFEQPQARVSQERPTA